MPYKVMKRGPKFVVVKATTGQVMGTHPTQEKAQAQVAALYANEKK